MTNEKDQEDDTLTVDRRGALECMLWAGTGVLWTIAGGVPSSALIGSAHAQAAGLTRRQLLAMATVACVGATGVATAGPASAAATGTTAKPYDRRTVDEIDRKLAANGYGFQSLIYEVVRSLPFQSRRGEQQP